MNEKAEKKTEKLKNKKPDQASLSKPSFAGPNSGFSIQRKFGNQGTLEYFKAGVAQAKLSVSSPGDIYEQEADRVADTVIRMAEPQIQNTPEEEEKLQTKPITPVTTLQRELLNDEEETPLQGKDASASAQQVDSCIETNINNMRGSGQPLPSDVREFFEPRFGHDFSNVKVHTGSQATESAKAVNAKAFTIGNDVVFGAGQYSPDHPEGKKLIAHELTHVIQQSGTAQRKIMRVVSDADVETDFNKWAQSANEKIDKNSDDYPHQLWTYIATLIMDQTTYGPIKKPPASDPKKVEEWKKKFEKAVIVVKWLFAIKATSKSDAAKSAAESRASGILDFMEQTGLVTQAINLSGDLDNENRSSLFTAILKNPTSASATELETITTFMCANQADPSQVEIVKSMSNGNPSPLKSMDAARTEAIFKVLIAKYPNHDKIVETIAVTLMFNPGIRQSISDDFMAGKTGSPDLLFKVLKSKYFLEPEYGATTFAALRPSGMSDEDYEKKRMKDDMPWVYTYKQKYYVQYLIDLAKSQKITIPQPAFMTASGLKTWLESNTEKIADAAKNKYPNDPDAVFEIYRNIADIFFYHIPHDRDVKPDLKGKITHLQEGAPSKKRLEADCDVFATYAMRLFNSAGFEPIGYIDFIPEGKDAARAAHTAALIRKNGAYYVINNKGILNTSISETALNAKKTDAIKSLRQIAFDDAYGDPKPTELKIYYSDAGPNGEMPKLFFDQDSSLERPDLK